MVEAKDFFFFGGVGGRLDGGRGKREEGDRVRDKRKRERQMKGK